MKKYTIKDLLSGAYLVYADDFNKSIYPQQKYVFKQPNSILEVALFDKRKEAIKAYEEYFGNMPYYAGIVEEVITCL